MSVCVCVCVCACVSLFVCVCVCVRESVVARLASLSNTRQKMLGLMHTRLLVKACC